VNDHLSETGSALTVLSGSDSEDGVSAEFNDSINDGDLSMDGQIAKIAKQPEKNNRATRNLSRGIYNSFGLSQGKSN